MGLDRSTLRRVTLLLFVGLISFLPIVFAEHEPFHRYTVTGYIKDANGNPLTGEEVVVNDKTAGIVETGTTDRNGKYTIQVHLHDENNGDGLEISARGVSYATQVRFNSADQRTERGLSVDLAGDKWAAGEFSLGGSDIKSGLLLVVLLLAGAFYMVRGKGSKGASSKKLKKKKM